MRASVKLWTAIGVVAAGATVCVVAAKRDSARLGPPVHDVATDWRDPVMFSPTLLRVRGPAAVAVETAPAVAEGPRGAFLGRTIAEVNRTTCPGASTLRVAAAAPRAFAVALVAIRAAGLTTVDVSPPRMIEATQSQIFGGPQDLALRIRPEGSGARLDMRSISRRGQNDGGSNCARISRLRARLARQLAPAS